MTSNYKIDTQHYPIFIGEDALTQLSEYILEYYSERKIFILVDNNTHELCLPELDFHCECLETAEVFEIESGEDNKSIDVVSGIWQTLLERKADRDALIINLGGGVISDMGGFVASTYMRGIDFINIPTTLLAQVDASVGGKVGVDFNGLKNLIGLFSFPKAVFVYPKFLETLPQQQLISGFAEIIKHALICDKDYWEKIKIISFNSVLHIETELIKHSIEIKNDIVANDFQEKGKRKKLNFGHTIGHALESIFIKTETLLQHGHAVAAGMVCESYLSNMKSGLTGEEMNEIVSFIKTIFSPVLIQTLDYQKVIDLIKHDKKNSHSQTSFALLKEIGEAEINHVCSDEEIAESLDFYVQTMFEK